MHPGSLRGRDSVYGGVGSQPRPWPMGQYGKRTERTSLCLASKCAELAAPDFDPAVAPGVGHFILFLLLSFLHLWVWVCSDLLHAPWQRKTLSGGSHWRGKKTKGAEATGQFRQWIWSPSHAWRCPRSFLTRTERIEPAWNSPKATQQLPTGFLMPCYRVAWWGKEYWWHQKCIINSLWPYKHTVEPNNITHINQYVYCILYR